MAFAVADFHDLVRLLEEHPEWRADLRRLVLSDELLALPERMASLEATVDRIGEALEQLTLRIDALTLRVDAFAERMDERFTRIDQRLDRLEDHVGSLRGWKLEHSFAERVYAYLGGHLTRIRVLAGHEVEALLEMREGAVTEAERRELFLADVVLRGRRRSDGAEIYLVGEVSAGVGLDDVTRAARRSEILGKLVPAAGFVAGERVLPDAAELANRLGVWQVTNGHVEPAE